MTMPVEAGKWSRNLNEEAINESNRSRLIEKQRQLLETKRTRQQQVTITSTRPKSARSLRPASSLSRSSEKLLDSRDISSLGGIVNPNRSQDDDDEDDDDDLDVNDEDDVHNNNKSVHQGVRPRTGNSSKRSSSPSPSMSPIDQGITTGKGRTASSISTTATIGTAKSSSSSAATISSKLAGRQRTLSNRGSGGKSVSSSYEDLKDDVETIKSMDINDNGIELNPLKTILNNNELLLFATQPVSPCKTYQCIIMRDKRGIDRSFYPTYYIYLQSIIDRQIDGENDHSEGKNGSISSPGTNDKDLSFSESKSISIRNNNKTLNSSASTSLSTTITTTTITNTTATATIKPGASRRQVFLLGGRRRKKSKTYLISNDPFDITRDNCIAKLKSNVLGTLFNGIRISNDRQRYEIAAIIYETNVLGFKGPRKMTVIIPKNDEVCPFPSSSLLELWKADPANKSLIPLKNKTPVWNEDTQSYVLNFHGRVTQPSVKNFQLAVAKKSDNNAADIDDIIYTGSNMNPPAGNFVNLNDNHSGSSSGNSSNKNGSKGEGDKMSPSTGPSTPTFFPTNPAPNSGSIGQLDEDIAMQFGRISDKEFTCDVTWPLSIIQAFCIALSSFDSKLACE